MNEIVADYEYQLQFRTSIDNKPGTFEDETGGGERNGYDRKKEKQRTDAANRETYLFSEFTIRHDARRGVRTSNLKLTELFREKFE